MDATIKEMKKLSSEFKKRNGNSSLRIPNKDFNLWIVYKLTEQDGRIKVIDTRSKITLALFPIIIAVVGVCYAIF